MVIHKDVVSKLSDIDSRELKGMQEDLEALDASWRQAYSDYQAQNGGWETLGLMNSSGDSSQLRLDGQPPRPTEILDQLPHIRSYLVEEAKLDILLARLAKIEPGGWMHEHHDDVELGEQKRLRLHIPIKTTPESRLTINTGGTNQSVHLEEGEVWKLEHERFPHAACNSGSEERVHLIIDCLVNDTLLDLINKEEIPSESLRPLPPLSSLERQKIIDSASERYQAAQLAGSEIAMRYNVERLLATFHEFDLRGESSLELVVEMLESLEPSGQHLDYWKERLSELLTIS